MESVQSRLIPCFTVAFPRLPPGEAPKASIHNLPAWDSSNHIMSMKTIEEAFCAQIPEEVLGEIESFSGFEDYLTGKSVES
jgi:hypothetical protein